MRTGTATQQDGAAQAPALTAQACLVAAAAIRVEQVDAMPRPAAQAGEAPMAQEQVAQEQVGQERVAQEQAAQVTQEVTWRHCMATAPPAERAARQPAGPVQAAQMVEARVEPASAAESGLTARRHSAATARAAQVARLPVVAVQVRAALAVQVAPVTVPASDRMGLAPAATEPVAQGEPAEAAMRWRVNPVVAPAGAAPAGPAAACPALAATTP